ncbi:acyl-CoA dehydrogenase [Acinetobacter sp. ACNIH3]|jgi:alkylation response protein AidB-like acyl-CoA dehydrogenase|uniref:acyl-CoA dehydrogenase C-terminal domain-containing protein n=1 Tax=Acinetobacter TaxID=469 RepID=UPI000CDE0A22|nr:MULTISPECIES: acyl-CoA dehydrogenase C-terminal domain-containing protein [Acinetobacter]POU24970.1 acyl-CoA dehydrogenase [Acinetobacter sp. ACNIH3]POV79185.1 acyl-CoA dehydrogenase [Acinetobacter sp. ACNIH4]
MRNYIAPLKDMKFVLKDLLNVEQKYQGYAKFADKVSMDIMEQYLEVAADFCQNELLPINATGDQQGCRLQDGVVTTPDGFKAAYDKYVELGFTSLTGDEAYGGQGFPTLYRIAISEIITATNWSWGMYPGLSHGAMRTLEHHGSDEQKQKFLVPLIAGRWTGTMCLTESHAGSDLGLIRTKAVPNEDGSYSLSGEKIFISAGEHDLAENIVHIVLARLPDAPAGTKGISLFIVPKYNLDEAGNVASRNGVVCSAIEHKMGIHGNATCVLNFDNAKGFLIGPENRGLNCMFTFMNSARIGTAIQGLAAAESSYQGALAYAKDRLAMRSLEGAKAPGQPADPIIVHPAVRNMLLTQKVFAEGSRALAYYLATYADIAEATDSPEEKKAAEDRLALLTPIAKALMTETGIEAAKHGMQVFGGHGYIAEHGMEQIARDARIASLYEGTTEIQSIDLLARKVLGSKLGLLTALTDEIQGFVKEHQQDVQFSQQVAQVSQLTEQWLKLTKTIQEQAQQSANQIGAASVDYLYFSGYVVSAYLWLKMAITAQQKIEEGNTDPFYAAKIKTAQFFFARILPRTSTHLANIQAGGESLFLLEPEEFKFD